MEDWSGCRNVLVIRADNMGDLLMSSPAIGNLKQHLNCKVTVLTSTKGAAVAALLPQIDELMVYDVPWVKVDDYRQQVDFHVLLELVKDRGFDACVVFTVYSQNPMPALMLAYLANIPLRLAYCRENPYHLLTNWVPDQEPYHLIRHQVSRDLGLVASIGVKIREQQLHLQMPPDAFDQVTQNLKTAGLSLVKGSYYLLHPGVSEQKRSFPKARWIALAKALIRHSGLPVLITGSISEQSLAEEISTAAGEGCFSVAGMFQLPAFSALIADAKVVVSVNTGTVHLAAAVQTPVVVLHAQTNPQHGPWMVAHTILAYSIPEHLKSKNEVVKWVDQQMYAKHMPLPETDEILAAVVAIA